jgi:hypothetical protein
LGARKAARDARVEQRERLVVTNVRITNAQWLALKQEALDLTRARGGGKADASEVLRGILDDWLDKRGGR